MRRWIGFENNTLWTPRLLLGEIAQAHAATRTKSERIVQYGVHFGITRDRIDIPFVEKNDRACLPQ